MNLIFTGFIMIVATSCFMEWYKKDFRGCNIDGELKTKARRWEIWLIALAVSAMLATGLYFTFGMRSHWSILLATVVIFVFQWLVDEGVVKDSLKRMIEKVVEK